MAKIFYYVNTGHRVGLDRFRRASAIMHHLKEADITLLTNDFRIASQAKAYHFRKAVGVDVLRNITNIAQRGDKLIYDSPEHNPAMYADMQSFFAPLLPIEEDLVAVDEVFETPVTHSDEVVLFFGDDDYEKDLLRLAKESQLGDVAILLGFYYFLECEEELAPWCKKIYEEESYIDAIKGARLLITMSFQAALEAAIAGTKVVYMQRVDYPEHYAQTLSALGISVVPYAPITQKQVQEWSENLSHINITNGAKNAAEYLKKSLLI
ncbi:MAG: hypothetical protein KU28_01910 [Sulfurovum sp. PC08-66]|nr:MAG: hypothetical protein KU28_01910 [Sulfurovum sp. PC08-66]KIM12685.1 MAG: hypothetical protein KU37_02015 [Sulfuricurvum sp. PC08-66]